MGTEKEKCKACGKTKKEHINKRWCNKIIGSCGSNDWQEFNKGKGNGN